MQKRTRRKASEIERLRSKILKVVKKERNITLTDLVRLYGASIGIRDTPSDKNLAKRQLDTLANADHISFKRNGRDLVARYLGEPAEGPDPVPVGRRLDAFGAGDRQLGIECTAEFFRRQYRVGRHQGLRATGG